MARYDGVYACGHEGSTQIYGPTKDRQWKADRHFERVCSDCWAEQKKKEGETAAAKAAEVGLPELTGSPKQISWANTIRSEIIKSVEAREGIRIFLRSGRFTEEHVEEALKGLRNENREVVHRQKE